ncbi:hypothetical protein KAM400_25260 [Acinetobacter sp. KAM400]|nr:hypothetical protein KAM400_25260 [Acinetobacter sp. KAM400]
MTLLFLANFSEAGEGYENFAKRIKQLLKDPVNLDKYSDYLDNLDLKV